MWHGFGTQLCTGSSEYVDEIYDEHYSNIIYKPLEATRRPVRETAQTYVREHVEHIRLSSAGLGEVFHFSKRFTIIIPFFMS